MSLHNNWGKELEKNIFNGFFRLHTSLLDSIPNGILIIEKNNGKVIYANKSAKELCGVDPSGLEMSNQPTKLKLLTLNGAVYATEQIPTSRALITGKIINDELMIERPDGSRITVETSASPIKDKNGKIIAALAIFQNITERKEAEMQLIQLKERFELTQKAAQIGVWDWDIGTGKNEWAPEMFHLFGLDSNKDDASLEIWESLLHPEDKKNVLDKLNRAIKDHKSLENVYRIIQPDGKIVWINALGKAIYDKKGQPIRMVGICLDITKQKTIEEQLREQNLVISSTTDTIFSTDESFVIKSWNRAAEQTFGWKAEEVIGKASPEVLNPVYSSYAHERAHAKLMSNGSWHGELICHKKDSSPISI